MRWLLLVLMVSSSTAHAQFLTGNNLLSDLQSSETVRRTFATGYIAGIADTLESITFCIPSGVNLGQLRDMTEQYLLRNSSIRNLAADVLVVGMLSQRWPCKHDSSGRGT
jgi:hypothetical protein